MEVVQQVATYLETQGLGTLDEDIFIVDARENDPDVCVVINQNSRDRKALSSFPANDYSFQFFVRSVDPVAGLQKVNAIADLFTMDTSQAQDLRNGHLIPEEDGGNQVIFTELISGPASLGLDKSKKYCNVVNVLMRILN